MATVIIKKITESEMTSRGIKNWPIWEKAVSKFDWTYDSEEECFFLNGEVVVETENGNYTIKSGDFVIFPKGLKCVWDIKQDVKKHYNFK